MRRLRRWAFNGLAAVSALLLVVVCVLWVRSYSVSDTVRHGSVNGGTSISSVTWVALFSRRGVAGMDWGGLFPVLSQQESAKWRSWDRKHPIAGWRWQRWRAKPANERSTLGFIFFRENEPNPAVCDTIVGVPYWFLAFALVATLALLLRKRLVGFRRQTRRNDKHCPKCGYDLRATLDRCPECGTVPTKKGATT